MRVLVYDAFMDEPRCLEINARHDNLGQIINQQALRADGVKFEDVKEHDWNTYPMSESYLVGGQRLIEIRCRCSGHMSMILVPADSNLDPEWTEACDTYWDSCCENLDRHKRR